jgi:hypothetical protein
VECEEGTRKHTFIFLTLNIRNYEKSQKTSRKLNFQRLDWRNIFIAQNTLLNFELQYIPITNSLAALGDLNCFKHFILGRGKNLF